MDADGGPGELLDQLKDGESEAYRKPRPWLSHLPRSWMLN
jgi:hypothetical protein